MTVPMIQGLIIVLTGSLMKEKKEVLKSFALESLSKSSYSLNIAFSHFIILVNSRVLSAIGAFLSLLLLPIARELLLFVQEVPPASPPLPPFPTTSKMCQEEEVV